MKRLRQLTALLCVMYCANVFAACNGAFINPLTDICWSCLFPLSIGPAQVNGGLPDPKNPSSVLCLCPKPPSPLPIPGIPVGFWEPIRLVDVVRQPFCLVGMGGLELGHGSLYGTHSSAKRHHSAEHSFYHVHWYIYPLIYWLEVLTDFVCLSSGDFDLAWLTEFDPTWGDDELNFILNPESVLFANPLAQVACSADCAAATAHLPLDNLFWCGGCQGSLYPFAGTVPNHAGGVQASLLLLQRFMAKGHRTHLMQGTMGTTNSQICQPYPMPVIKKSQYRAQMVYPRAATNSKLGCHPLGRSSLFLESGREFPYKGEDFSYVVWRKKNCCLL